MFSLPQFSLHANYFLLSSSVFHSYVFFFIFLCFRFFLTLSYPSSSLLSFSFLFSLFFPLFHPSILSFFFPTSLTSFFPFFLPFFDLISVIHISSHCSAVSCISLIFFFLMFYFHCPFSLSNSSIFPVYSPIVSHFLSSQSFYSFFHPF